MSRNGIKKFGVNHTSWDIIDLIDMLNEVNELYNEYHQKSKDYDEKEGRMYNNIEHTIDDLIVDLEMYSEHISELMYSSNYEASAKKSRRSRMNKALNKLGGFTKEGEEESEGEEIEIEIDDDEDSEEDVEVEIDSDDESENMIERRCNSEKSMRANKRRKMRKEGVNLPEDADDQQEVNQKGSGNAGTDLPEDADDQQEVNDKGTGNAGTLMPEDADDVTEDKRVSSRKNMRKFSVTSGGSPNQESYIQRYNQAPRMREAIDRHFGTGPKSDPETQMLQERLDKMAKSRRNTTANNVPTRLRKY